MTATLTPGLVALSGITLWGGGSPQSAAVSAASAPAENLLKCKCLDPTSDSSDSGG